MSVGLVARARSETVALQLLSNAAKSSGSPAAAASPWGAATTIALSGSSQTVGNASDAWSTYSAAGTLPDGESAVAAIKAMAKSNIFRNAALGTADDQVRALVRDGQIATLPALSDAQYASLSTAERNIYGVVRTLQGLYDAQPKTVAQALSDHVSVVLESYPDMIAREKDGLASGTLPATDGWNDVIARQEEELTAAREGRMQIHAVNDQSLVSRTDEFTVSGGDSGWSGAGTTINADIPALQKLYGTQNVLAGGSPYCGNYVITW